MYNEMYVHVATETGRGHVVVVRLLSALLPWPAWPFSKF